MSRDLTYIDPPQLPWPDDAGFVAFEGADIAFASYGDGPPVLLLHGALGNSQDWANQVPALRDAGFRPILIDNRGRGRSTAGQRRISYELMAQEALAVLDRLGIYRFCVAGWSDGAILSLILAMRAPDRVERAFAYAANMDLAGVHAEFVETQPMRASFARAREDYARLSPTPDGFEAMLDRMNGLMRAEPNFSAAELGRIAVPVAIAHGLADEFIRFEHAAYLAETIPDAQLFALEGVSHFAPWQDPAAFNAALIAFLRG